MLILLLACTGSSPEDSATSVDSEDSGETEATDTATDTTGIEPERADVSCEGSETYNETLALGWVPPTPVVVEVWGHHADWWIASQAGPDSDPENQIESWYLAPVQISENGGLLLFCEYKNLTNIDPSYIGFTTDQYVVYTKPL